MSVARRVRASVRALPLMDLIIARSAGRRPVGAGTSVPLPAAGLQVLRDGLGAAFCGSLEGANSVSPCRCSSRGRSRIPLAAARRAVCPAAPAPGRNPDGNDAPGRARPSELSRETGLEPVPRPSPRPAGWPSPGGRTCRVQCSWAPPALRGGGESPPVIMRGPSSPSLAGLVPGWKGRRSGWCARPGRPGGTACAGLRAGGCEAGNAVTLQPIRPRKRDA